MTKEHNMGQWSLIVLLVSCGPKPTDTSEIRDVNPCSVGEILQADGSCLPAGDPIAPPDEPSGDTGDEAGDTGGSQEDTGASPS
jgi:hypothetical protein